MPKNSYIRILLTFGMSLVLFLAGCVDTSVQPIPSTFNFRSQVNIVNLSPDLISEDFSMTTHAKETISFGTIAYGNESAGGFKDVPAGSKVITFGSESLKINTEVDKRMRLFIFGTGSKDREVGKNTLRYIFQSPNSTTNEFWYRSDTASILFVNGSTDTLAITKIMAFSGTDTLGYAMSPEYTEFSIFRWAKAGEYTFNIYSSNKAGDGDTLLTSFPANLASMGRYTAAIYGEKTSLKVKLFTDD